MDGQGATILFKLILSACFKEKWLCGAKRSRRCAKYDCQYTQPDIKNIEACACSFKKDQVP